MSTAITRLGGGFALAPSNWGELMQFAELAAKSDLVPKDYRGKPANVALAVQWGGELGIGPMQALQNIAVINGKPGIYGDLMLALCMTHPDYVDTIETWDEKTQTATCVAKRKGREDKVWTFGPEDVKRANLGNTHNQYPRRMKQFRARGFALRDQWPDRLKGIISLEEAQDYPKEVRAEVTESKPVTEPAPLKPLAVVEDRPKFSEQWTDKNWAGKPLEEAPSAVLLDYGQYLSTFALDKGRPKRAESAKKAVAQVQAIIDSRMAAEADKVRPKPAEPDDIASKLQDIVDGVHERDLEAGKDTPDDDNIPY